MNTAAPASPPLGLLPPRVAVRYVAPLREGGSVPALVEADDGQLYVVKLRGAAQGARALISEIIVGTLAQACGLPMPALAIMTVELALARTEPHQEIADALRNSVGSNAALGFLPAAVGFDPATRPQVDGAMASRLVLFDAYVENVDRTPRNPNLLWSGGTLWLIDHGAALYWQHDWDGSVTGYGRGFPLMNQHVLLPWANDLPGAAAALSDALTDAALEIATERVPDDWLTTAPAADAQAVRQNYRSRLARRREALPKLLEEAQRARALVV